MRRCRPGSQSSPETGQSSGLLEVPTHWTPAQATAVFEVLDDLVESVWRSYGVQIQQVLRRDRVVKTSRHVLTIEPAMGCCPSLRNQLAQIARIAAKTARYSHARPFR